MQVALLRRAVLAGGEHQQVSARQKLSPGEGPFAGRGGIVGEGPAGQLDPLGPEVAQLDPVGAVAILVAQAALVGGEDLVDHQLSSRGVGVDDVGPAFRGEVVRGHEEIADLVVLRPVDCHLAFGGLFELEDVGPCGRAADAVRLDAVDEQVARVNVGYRFAEGYLDAPKLPDACVESRQQAGDGGRGCVDSHGVDEGEVELRIAGGGGCIEQLNGDGVRSCDDEIRGGGQVEDLVGP